MSRKKRPESYEMRKARREQENRQAALREKQGLHSPRYRGRKSMPNDMDDAYLWGEDIEEIRRRATYDRLYRREDEESGEPRRFSHHNQNYGYDDYRYNQADVEESPYRRKKAPKRKKPSLIKKVLLVFVLLFLGAMVLAYLKLGDSQHNPLNEEQLEISYRNPLYRNIALFGLDSRNGEISQGARSDCIMIASINRLTKKVKIVSVYRDTLLEMPNGDYAKANAAYVNGAQNAVAMLNRNLDLNIKDYVTVNFNSLADVVDLLGGVQIEVDEEERNLLNQYSAETSQIVGRSTSPLEGTGLQTLNGIQAVSFARIRYTKGNDFKRAQRQRIVLDAILQKMKHSGPRTLYNVASSVLPKVSTSLSPGQLMLLGAPGPIYRIGEMNGFPYKLTTSSHVQGLRGSYVVPINLAQNVADLHNQLFGEQGYHPTSKVQAISQNIIDRTGVTEQTAGDGIDNSQYSEKKN